MPEVYSVGLGGGTKVFEEGGVVTVGPESTGHRLLQEGLVFGGDTLTATGQYDDMRCSADFRADQNVTDIVVASGKADIGDVSRVEDVPADVISKARIRIKRILEQVVDGMKLSAEDAIVILVGGGSIIQMDDLEGVSKVIRPQFHDCANAVGAAISKVSGHLDLVKVLEGQDEVKVIEDLCEQAKQKAVDAGALPSSVQIISMEDMPLQYVQMRASRFVIRAAGGVSAEALLEDESEAELLNGEPSTIEAESKLTNSEKAPEDFLVSPSASVNVKEYTPEVDSDGTWWVSEVDCEFLATGCSILACGGGGPGYMCYLAARALIQQGKRLPVVDIDTLPSDGLVFSSVSYGAPTVTLERLPSGTESIDATDAQLRFYPGQKMAAQIAVCPFQILRAMLNLFTAGDWRHERYPANGCWRPLQSPNDRWRLHGACLSQNISANAFPYATTHHAL